MANPIKQPWSAPVVTQFETPEDLLAFYRENLSEADFETLVRLAEQMQRSARRDPGRVASRKSARG